MEPQAPEPYHITGEALASRGASQDRENLLPPF